MARFHGSPLRCDWLTARFRDSPVRCDWLTARVPVAPPAGARENSIDSLALDTLIPKPIVQRYLNLLTEHRRIILSGPSGTGKSFLAGKLAQYIACMSGREVTEATVASFSVDHESSKVRHAL